MSHTTNVIKRYNAIQVERDGLVEYVTLNRPDRLNAMNLEGIRELLDYFTGLERDDLFAGTKYADLPVKTLSPRVVVLRGNGRAFCAGLDLRDSGELLSGTDGLAAFNFQRVISEIVIQMKRVKQPIVCCIHGPTAGLGLALMASSQIRYASKDSKMNVAMAKIGLTGCDIGLSYQLPRLFGPSTAAEMMMTGRFLSAERAYSLGAISGLFDTKEACWEAGKVVAEEMIETTPTLGLALTKEGLLHGIDAPSLESAIALEDRQQILMMREPTLLEFISKGFKKKSKI